MTYLEQKRAQAQQLYKEEQEYWAKNADEIRRCVLSSSDEEVVLTDDCLPSACAALDDNRLMEEDRQKQIAEGRGSLMSFMGGPKPPQPEAK